MAQIKTEEAYNVALKRIEELEKLVNDNTPNDSPEYLELDMLCDLVEEYEAIHYPIGKPSLIAAMLGISAPRLSEIMTGKAEPSLSIARALYQKLNISADVILG